MDPAHTRDTMRIRMKLEDEDRQQLKQLIAEHQDIFAWGHEDILGIDGDVIEHYSNVNLETRPVKQRKRSFSTEKYVAIAEEVNCLLAAGFIGETHYSE